MEKVKKSEGQTKSYWSSSNDMELVSPAEFSLRNLNFSTLVNRPEENNKSESDNANNVSLGEDNKQSDNEMEIRIDSRNASGYETPYLGMKLNPSYENLRKHSDADSSLEEIYRYSGQKIVPNYTKTGLTSSSSDSSSSDSPVPPTKYNKAYLNYPRNMLNNSKPVAHLPKGLEHETEKESETEIAYDFAPETVKTRPRQRSSSYRDSLQQFRSRVSQNKFNNKEETKNDDAFSRLLWGGYHKIVNTDTRDSHKKESEDDEAILIDSQEIDPISYLHQSVIRRKERNSKSNEQISRQYKNQHR